MKTIFEAIKKIYKEKRGLFALLIVNFLLGAGVFLVAILNLNPAGSIVKTGYGDIVGGYYRDGSWTSMLVFPLMAILFGVLHAFLVAKIFERRGAGLAYVVAFTTTMLICGVFVVLIRLLGEM